MVVYFWWLQGTKPPLPYETFQFQKNNGQSTCADVSIMIVIVMIITVSVLTVLKITEDQSQGDTEDTENSEDSLNEDCDSSS